MTKEEMAEKLNGIEYPGREIHSRIVGAKDAGLVAVYGQSDDLLEFNGAIYEELSAWNGTTVKLDKGGLVVERCQDEDCPYDKEKAEKAPHWVKAEWCPPSGKGVGYSFFITASVPFATFDIVEGEEKYCRGIVFDMKSLAETL